MDDNQKDNIKSKLSQLVELTDCNTTFLVIFVQNEIITQDECEKLTAKDTKISKAEEFYKIIQTRKGAYEVLINALTTTRQSGAKEILQLLPPPPTPREPATYQIESENELLLDPNGGPIYISEPRRLVLAVLLMMITITIICVVILLLFKSYKTDYTQAVSLSNPEDLDFNKQIVCKSGKRTNLTLFITKSDDWINKTIPCGDKINSLMIQGIPSLVILHHFLRQTPFIVEFVLKTSENYNFNFDHNNLERLAPVEIESLKILSIDLLVEDDSHNWMLLSFFGRVCQLPSLNYLYIHSVNLTLTQNNIALSKLLSNENLKTIKLTGLISNSEISNLNAGAIETLDISFPQDLGTKLAQDRFLEVINNFTTIANVQTNVIFNKNLSNLLEYFKAKKVETAVFALNTSISDIKIRCVAAASMSFKKCKIVVFGPNSNPAITLDGSNEIIWFLNGDKISEFKNIVESFSDFCNNPQMNQLSVKIAFITNCFKFMLNLNQSLDNH